MKPAQREPKKWNLGGNQESEISEGTKNSSPTTRTGCEISEGTEKVLSGMRFNRHFADTFRIKGNI